MRLTKSGCLFLAVIFCVITAACQKDKDTLYSLDETIVPIKNAVDVDWRDEDDNPSYNEAYLNYPFYSDRNDSVTYAANAMWDIYGDITVQQGEAVWAFGTEPSWYEWIGRITNWYGNDWRKAQLKGFLLDRPITADGYIWSWFDSPHWPNFGEAKPLHSGYHFDNNMRYITGVESVVLWENSTDFLFEIDNKRVAIADPEEAIHVKDDASVGMSVRDKVDAAMQYMLKDLSGETGIIVIDDAMDGKNKGRATDHGSNYWDNFPFGYKSAYETMLFYRSLEAMVNIEKMCGNIDEVEKYESLRAKVKTEFNKTFWSETNKRYIGCIDVDGIEHDYGFTFLNTEAINYGLADEVKVNHIYSWLTGNRMIETDTSTGADIYGKFKIAPRSITRAIEDVFTVKPDGKKEYWWFSNGNTIDVTSNAKFGQHLENGGIIFYTSYYDLMSRIKYISPESGLNRFSVIADEFAKDELRRDPKNTAGADWMIGLLGELPETGLVPTAYMYGFIGIDVSAKGLMIAPSIPADYQYVGVKDVIYGGNTYNIEVNKNGRVAITAQTKTDLIVALKDYAGKNSVTVKIISGESEVFSQKYTAVNGEFLIDLTGKTNGPAQIIIE